MSLYLSFPGERLRGVTSSQRLLAVPASGASEAPCTGVVKGKFPKEKDRSQIRSREIRRGTERLRRGTHRYVNGDGAVGSGKCGGGGGDQRLGVKRIASGNSAQWLIDSQVGVEKLELNRQITEEGHNGSWVNLIRPSRFLNRCKLDRDRIGLAVVVGTHVNRLERP